MDAKLLYAASEAMKHRVIWYKSIADNEWVYCSSNVQAVKKFIYDHFTSTSVYVISTWQFSIETKLSEIEKALEELLEVKNFFFWNTTFDKVIEFNNIGVMRKGDVNSSS